METSVTLDFQRSWHRCAFLNKTGQNDIQPTYHLHIMLHILFDQAHMQTAWVTHHLDREHPQHTSELSSPRHHPFTPEGSLYSSSSQYANTPQATWMLLTFTATSRCLFCEGLPERDGSRKRKAPTAAKNDHWLRNNGTSCVILTAPRTPDVLPALILCSFYLPDHGCLLRLVVSFLALEQWHDLTNMVMPLAKRTEKKGWGNERNALIAARI